MSTKIFKQHLNVLSVLFKVKFGILLSLTFSSRKLTCGPLNGLYGIVCITLKAYAVFPVHVEASISAKENNLDGQPHVNSLC